MLPLRTFYQSSSGDWRIDIRMTPEERNQTSLVTTCMDRYDLLEKALPTWLDLDFGEIIIVDWSSQIPVVEQLPEKIINEVIVCTVPKKEFFSVTKARNTGFRISRKDYIFFVDSDVALNKKLAGSGIHPNEDTFYRGYAQTSGTVLLSRNSFTLVNGYNERYDVYGGEDAELYTRLAHHEKKMRWLFLGGNQKNAMKKVPEPRSYYVEHINHNRSRCSCNFPIAHMKGTETTKINEQKEAWKTDESQERQDVMLYVKGGPCENDYHDQRHPRQR